MCGCLVYIRTGYHFRPIHNRHTQNHWGMITLVCETISITAGYDSVTGARRITRQISAVYPNIAALSGENRAAVEVSYQPQSKSRSVAIATVGIRVERSPAPNTPPIGARLRARRALRQNCSHQSSPRQSRAAPPSCINRALFAPYDQLRHWRLEQTDVTPSNRRLQPKHATRLYYYTRAIQHANRRRHRTRPTAAIIVVDIRDARSRCCRKY